VSDAEVQAALAGLHSDLRDALQAAADQVRAFQESMMPGPHQFERSGISIAQSWSPVQRAGCYVPGGLALYPSSVLMTAIPARVAAVDSVALCVPPGPDGHVPALVLAAAAISGVDDVYRIGGAQAIAAMAYGTESVPRVDVIVGPGNIYVATAKQEVSGTVGVPSSFAGPSEVVVIADELTPQDYAALDLVVQAEHGPDGLAWLITWSEEAATRITAIVDELVQASPRREEIESTLRDSGFAVLVDGPREAMVVANAIAPEHLELMNADYAELIPLVRNAGAVFTGLCPASVGDYVAGSTHVLPVYGSARYGSALSVYDFLRVHNVISVPDPGTFETLAPTVSAIADAEGLTAHGQSVTQRAADARAGRSMPWDAPPGARREAAATQGS
jgi:histidinol dehydrogenase